MKKGIVSILLMLLFSPLASAELVVIANSALVADGLDKRAVKQLFLGKTRKLAGTRVVLLDQSAGSAEREQFYSQVTGKSAAQLKSYWSRLIFTGKGKPPEVVGDGAAVKARVASTSGAVGYVDAGQVDGSVKVLFRLP
ncbi:MAG: phosphate ABC transporter substrate-binding protein [Marinobacterium sp.]|nr:phosphate ABC transporter substrate-binding protein [Marinobacterium sp.]